MMYFFVFCKEATYLKDQCCWIKLNPKVLQLVQVFSHRVQARSPRGPINAFRGCSSWNGKNQDPPWWHAGYHPWKDRSEKDEVWIEHINLTKFVNLTIWSVFESCLDCVDEDLRIWLSWKIMTSRLFLQIPSFNGTIPSSIHVWQLLVKVRL